MSFKAWFGKWYRAFFKLLTVNGSKWKSDAQIERDRERWRKAKRESARRYRRKKKIIRRRKSYQIQNMRLIGAMLRFAAVSLGILFIFPFGLLDWGRKSAAAKKTRARRDAVRAESDTRSAGKKKSASSKACAEATPRAAEIPTKADPAEAAVPASAETLPSEAEVEAATKAAEPKEPDENTPRSSPKNEKDRYIRRRMIIAGSYYCEKAVLDTLAVGTYFDLEAEPENPYDKDAVRLTYNGQKIGYIPKKDRLAFVTCLKLKQRIYGVITAIRNEDGQTKYEFETWFDSAK